MRIAFIAHVDPASAGYNYARAITAYAHPDAKAFYRGTSYAAPDNDGDVGSKECVEWVAGSDVVIGQVSGSNWSRDYLAVHADKVTHWWIDGGPHRGAASSRKGELAGKPLIATNHDVADEYGAHWLPCCIAPYVEDGSHSREYAGSREIVHLCSDPSVKNTDVFRAAMSRMAPRWRHQVIGGLAHREAMKRVRSAAALFDHMQGYFGVASLEATAMGVPVMNGLSARGWEVMHQWGVKTMPPWHIVTTKQGLEAQIDAGFEKWTDDERRAWYSSEMSNAIKAKRLVAWLEANR